jgi:YesN/AraC family two-component response regulator
MTLGAANYLTKPILEDDLAHALEKLKKPTE